MYQKYLLTGATTQLGKHIMALLLESGHSVRVLVHPDDETEFEYLIQQHIFYRCCKTKYKN